MKILLVNPLWTKPGILPTNLAELAGFVRSGGYADIEILDLNYELSEVQDTATLIDRAARLIESRSPDVLGITCNTIHVPFVAELCLEYGKSHHTPIVLGGIHPTFRPAQLLEITHAGYLVRGEGEQTFLELIRALDSKGDPSTIAGLSGMSGGTGAVFQNPDRPLLRKLSEMPFPAYDLLYRYGGQNRIYLSASRGCPFGCHFCSSHRMWHYQRRKEVQRVISEIAHMKENFIFDFIRFSDDCLTLNKEWLGHLLEQLNLLDIRWDCYSRVDTMDEETMKRMKDAGCTLVYHGIESGSQRLRDILGKKLMRNETNDGILRLVEQELNTGLLIYCSFMTAIPTETKEEMLQTIDLASRLKSIGATVQFWIMTPYPDIDAVRIYKEHLIRIDRWDLLRQADVFAKDQYHFYRSFYQKYERENPDFHMFRPAMELEEFFDLYREGRDRLLGPMTD